MKKFMRRSKIRTNNIAYRAHGKYNASKDEIVIVYQNPSDAKKSQVFETIRDNFRRTLKDVVDEGYIWTHEFDHKEYTNGTIRTVYIVRILSK